MYLAFFQYKELTFTDITTVFFFSIHCTVMLVSLLSQYFYYPPSYIMLNYYLYTVLCIAIRITALL